MTVVIRMKLIFCGTSEFAIPVLRALLESKHRVIAVLTKSEKPSGRGLKEHPTPVKAFVSKHSPEIPLLQPPKLKDEDFLKRLRELEPELFVVASFPIMPLDMVKIPRLGCLNVHPSLLPKYRGAAPIQWTLLKGETETGVTTFFIGGEVDAGGILLQQETEIYPGENFGSLHHRLAQIGAELALESLRKIETGDYRLQSQDENLATAAPKIKKEQRQIDWLQEPEQVCNQVRAFSPKPGAYTIINGRRLKVLKAKPVEYLNLPPGGGLCHKDGLFAGCKNGALEMLEVQVEGKKCMEGKAFVCGFKDDKIIFDY